MTTPGMDSTPQNIGHLLSGVVKDLEVRKLEFRDLKSVAQLHAAVFPDYFLTHLGQEVLQVFYSGFIDRNLVFANVVLIDGKIVGFVAGHSDSQEFFNHFYSKHFYTISKNVLFQIFSDQVIRRDIYSRIDHVKRAFASKLMRKNQAKGTNSSKVTTRLLSIGVDSDYRGRGIAEFLTDHFLGDVAVSGIDCIGLSVLKNNPRAIAFYEKTGWLRESQTSDTVLFWRSTKVPENNVGQALR
jgi:ribosomal protein S18 acetylase RimI-like enzyme